MKLLYSTTRGNRLGALVEAEDCAVSGEFPLTIVRNRVCERGHLAYRFYDCFRLRRPSRPPPIAAMALPSMHVGVFRSLQVRHRFVRPSIEPRVFVLSRLSRRFARCAKLQARESRHGFESTSSTKIRGTVAGECFR
jgi:hypothetical protein